MPTNAAYLADLEKAIRLRYHCNATYRQTDFVHEKTANNETVWIGNVEVFDLTDSKDASRCYAWENIGDGVQIVTILQSSFVDSALRAVQTAIYAGVQAPVRAPGDDTEIFMKRLEKAKKALHELEVQIKPEDLDAIMQTTRQNNGSVSKKRQ